MGWGAAQTQLLFDLRAGAVYNDDAQAHRREQRNIMDERVEPTRNDELARKSDDKRFAPKRMDVGGDATKPCDEGARIGG